MKYLLPMCLLLFSAFLSENSAAFAETRGTAQSESQVVESQLKDLEKCMFHPTVDARIDRVWHAIPGLCGTELDLGATLEKTEGTHDGKVHPVVKEISPKDCQIYRRSQSTVDLPMRNPYV